MQKCQERLCKMPFEMYMPAKEGQRFSARGGASRGTHEPKVTDFVPYRVVLVDS